MNDIDFREEYEEMKELGKLNNVLEDTKKAYLSAVARYGKFHSPHEGYAILLEELNELWDVVKLHPATPGRNLKIHEEASHVAVMAIRMIVDFGEKIE
jgi:hypothetical protein